MKNSRELSLKSKIYVVVGRFLYGEPKDFFPADLECSAEEFYALPSERYKVSPKFINHNNIQNDDVRKRNLFVDLYREKIYRHNAIAMTIINSIIISTLLTVGYGVQYVNHVTHEAIAKVDAKIEAKKEVEKEKKQLQDRINLLAQQAVQTTNAYKSNKINKDIYDMDIANLKANYKAAQDQLKALNQGE